MGYFVDVYEMILIKRIFIEFIEIVWYFFELFF